jgi:hypothetical protein
MTSKINLEKGTNILEPEMTTRAQKYTLFHPNHYVYAAKNFSSLSLHQVELLDISPLMLHNI